jgi:hypothetical protein
MPVARSWTAQLQAIQRDVVYVQELAELLAAHLG